MNKKTGYGRKNIIQNQLLTYAEGLIKDRRDKLRLRRVNSLKERTNIKLPLRQRDIYVEGKIEADIHYFRTVL